MPSRTATAPTSGQSPRITVVPIGALTRWAALIVPVYVPVALLGRVEPRLLALAVACTLVAGLAVVLLARTQVLDRAVEALDPRARRVLAAGIGVYFVASVTRALGLIERFGDLDQAALFNQMLWSTLHGHVFASSPESVDAALISHFGIHFSPTLLVLLPVYAVWPGAHVLMVAQALAVALIPVPLYRLLRRDLHAAPAALLALCALLVPSFLQHGGIDFREHALYPVLLLTAMWALESRRSLLLWLTLLVTLGVREDIGPVVVFMGLYALLAGHGRVRGLAMMALGLAWPVVVLRFVMPQFLAPSLWTDPTHRLQDVLGVSGASPAAALLELLAHPVELAQRLINGANGEYLFYLLQPLLVLPPFGDLVVLPAIPMAAINLLSPLMYMKDSYAQYSLAPLTFAVLATTRLAARLAAGAEAERRGGSGLAAAIVVVCGLLPSLAILPPKEAGTPPPQGPARAVVAGVKPGEAVYVPDALYIKLGMRERVACAGVHAARMLDPEFRARFERVILDPHAQPADAALAAALARDARFRRVEAVGPFSVYVRVR